MESLGEKILFRVLKVLCVVTIGFYVSSAAAQADIYTSVVGKWVTFDEKTEKASSVISIYRHKGLVYGKIAATFPVPGEVPMRHCRFCKGADKNKPIMGLNIIKNMRCAKGRCHGGRITDPRDGKVYRATMHLVDRGRLLKVRGYIGISLFGKTVVWRRYVPQRKAA